MSQRPFLPIPNFSPRVSKLMRQQGQLATLLNLFVNNSFSAILFRLDPLEGF